MFTQKANYMQMFEFQRLSLAQLETRRLIKKTSNHTMVLLEYRKLSFPYLISIVFLCMAALLIGCSTASNIPAIERQAQDIGRGIMCPVCPGESIDQSQHPLAAQMRAIVVKKLGEGWTVQQIESMFVDSYGPSVLLKPPTRGSTLIVWLIPPLVVVLTALALYMVLRSMIQPVTAHKKSDPEGIGFSREEKVIYFARVETALGKTNMGTTYDRKDLQSAPEKPPRL